MREVQAMVSEEIHLGRRGENLATCVTFDVSEWQGAGEGTVHLLHQRNGDEYPYPCAITVENGVATWIITAADVEFAGRGKAELQYLDGEVCIKSAVFVTKTLRALGKAGEAPPEPEENWVNQVLEAAGSAMESSEYAQQSAKEAEESAAAARASEASIGDAAASAAGSASAAKTSETNAKSSEEAARAAQQAAEKARDEAKDVVGGDFATKADAQAMANTAESNANNYTNQKIAAIPAPDVSGQIGGHNADTTAHADIRAVAAEAKNLAAGKADASHTHTAADVGAVSKAGDTMTGTKLGFRSGLSEIEAIASGVILRTVSAPEDYTNERYIRLKNAVGTNSISEALQLLDRVNGDLSTYNILHTGNMAALGCAKIETGSYVGTGKSGSSNKISLTFSFAPKLLIVICSDDVSSGCNTILAIKGTSTTGIILKSQIYQFISSSAKVTINFTDTGVNWYTTSGGGETMQLNESNKNYYYLAIG